MPAPRASERFMLQLGQSLRVIFITRQNSARFLLNNVYSVLLAGKLSGLEELIGNSEDHGHETPHRLHVIAWCHVPLYAHHEHAICTWKLDVSLWPLSSGR